jgi:hypothetical protein
MITKLLPKRRKEIRKKIKRIKMVKIIRYKVVFLIQITLKVLIQMILELGNKIQNKKIKIKPKKLKIQGIFLKEEIIKMVKIKGKKYTIMT